MWEEKALVLGRTGRGYDKLSVRAESVGKQGHRNNEKSFDLYFVLNRAIIVNCQIELIMNELKIMCKKVEHIKFLDKILFLPLSLRKLLDAFGLTTSKSLYPHYFNTK